MHSNHQLERKLSLRGFCVLFSFFSLDEEKQNEFLLIIKSALSLPLIYRKNTFDCLYKFIIKDNEDEEEENQENQTIESNIGNFSLTIKQKILDLLLLRLKRYTKQSKEGKNLLIIEKCFELSYSRNEKSQEIQSCEFWPELIGSIVLLSNQFPFLSNSLISDVKLQISDITEIHKIIFLQTTNTNQITSSSSMINGKLISPIKRMEFLISIYQILINISFLKPNNKFSSENLNFIHYYIILIYIKYHSNIKCKWNTHWNFYLEFNQNDTTNHVNNNKYSSFDLISLDSCIHILKYYSLHFKSQITTESIPLLNIYIFLKWIYFHLENLENKSSFLHIHQVKQIFQIGSEFISTIKESNNNLPPNYRNQLVDFNKLIRLLPSDGLYDKLILHCTSQETTSDLIDFIRCFIFQIFTKIFQIINSSQKDELGKFLCEILTFIPNYDDNHSNQSNILSWLHWKIYLLQWLKDEFDSGISVDVLTSYIDVIVYCCDKNSFLFIHDNEIDLIKQITNYLLNFLKNFPLDQHKIIKKIIDYLFMINSIDSSILIARNILLSTFNEEEDEEDEEDDEEMDLTDENHSNEEIKLKLSESKACILTSLKCAFEFYKTSLLHYRRNLNNTLYQLSSNDIKNLKSNYLNSNLLIIPMEVKKLIGDLLKILPLSMNEKMDFIQKYKQLKSILMLINSILLIGSFCCKIGKKFLFLLKKEFSISTLDDELFCSLELIDDKDFLDCDYDYFKLPVDHFIILIHSIIVFCFILDRWIIKYRNLLTSGSLPDLIQKKERFLLSIHDLLIILSKESIMNEKQISVLKNSLTIVEKYKFDGFVKTQDRQSNVKVPRKRKRVSFISILKNILFIFWCFRLLLLIMLLLEMLYLKMVVMMIGLILMNLVILLFLVQFNYIMKFHRMKKWKNKRNQIEKFPNKVNILSLNK